MSNCQNDLGGCVLYGMIDILTLIEAVIAFKAFDACGAVAGRAESLRANASTGAIYTVITVAISSAYGAINERVWKAVNTEEVLLAIGTAAGWIESRITAARSVSSSTTAASTVTTADFASILRVFTTAVGAKSTLNAVPTSIR